MDRRLRFVLVSGAALVALAVALTLVLAVVRDPHTGAGADPGTSSATTAPARGGSPTARSASPQADGPSSSSSSSSSPAPSDDGAAPPLATEPFAAGLQVYAPVAMDATADYGTGITASIVSVATVKGTGDGPGDRSGPALLVTARLTNVANGPTDLDATVVDLYGPDGAPAHVLEYDPRAKPFSGVLEEKASATATYVIDRPRAAGDITLTISYDGQTPAVAFTGAIPS